MSKQEERKHDATNKNKNLKNAKQKEENNINTFYQSL